MTEHLPECWAKHESDPPAWCICDELRACEERVLDRIVAGISAWCADDPVISRADPNDAWHYARGVRFTRLRIERGDFSD
jgi:hypothetical protein